MSIKPRQWAKQHASRSNTYEFNRTNWKVKGGDGYELIPGDNDLDNGLISKKNIYASYITWLDIAKPNDKTRISNRNVFGQKFLALARFKDKTLINSDKKNSQGDRCYQFGSIEELKKVFRSKF